MRAAVLARGEDPEMYPILVSRPELYPDLYWVWEAFMMLSSTRQQGMGGPQPISLTELLAYCQYHAIQDSEEREEILHLVQHLDRVFLAHYAEKSKSKANKPPPGIQ
jgi:hypothetical protein